MLDTGISLSPLPLEIKLDGLVRADDPAAPAVSCLCDLNVKFLHVGILPKEKDLLSAGVSCGPLPAAVAAYLLSLVLLSRPGMCVR